MLSGDRVKARTQDVRIDLGCVVPVFGFLTVLLPLCREAGKCTAAGGRSVTADVRPAAAAGSRGRR